MCQPTEKVFIQQAAKRNRFNFLAQQTERTKMNGNSNRGEAVRLLGIAEKLLQSRDLSGTKDFAVLAQENDPLLEGSDQILAVADVLLASEKRINNHHDWYSILQIERRCEDHDLIKKQYRRLALLLHPDKNKYAFADQAFKLVADSWAVLSDSAKKSLYDNELSLYSRVDLSNSSKLPVRRSQRPTAKKSGVENARSTVSDNRSDDRNQRVKLSTFWSMCPYCYILYEYPRVYENCCLRCPNCQRAFHAALISSLPPMVPGKDAYYCSWGFFPLGYVFNSADGGGKDAGPAAVPPAAFPNWMPPIFGTAQQVGGKSGGGATRAVPPARMGVQSRDDTVEISERNAPARMSSTTPARMATTPAGAPKKRGRPRKYPVAG